MRKSIVADLIDYDANPLWKKMINEIIEIKPRAPDGIKHEMDVDFYYLAMLERDMVYSLKNK